MLRNKLALVALSTALATLVAQPSFARAAKKAPAAPVSSELSLTGKQSITINVEFPGKHSWSTVIFAKLDDGSKVEVFNSKKDGSSKTMEIPASSDNTMRSVDFQVETVQNGAKYISKLWEGEMSEGDLGKETVGFKVPNPSHSFKFKFNDNANAGVVMMS